MAYILILIAGLLLFWGLGDRGLWGSEGRWAEVTREMFLTRDFFHPTIGGQPYFDKPLLTYWFIAGVSALTGTLNEWVVRLPSAIFGMVAVGATIFIGRRLWSPQVGNLAGALLLTSYGLLSWSRTACADTENLAAITLCILWYWLRRDRPNFTTFLVFYLIAFLGTLTKGLTAVAVPIVAVLPDVVTEKRWKHLLRPSHFLALLIGCGVYLAPFFYASATEPESYRSSGLALVFQENILRYFKPIDHKQPFYIYFYSVPVLVLPWAPLLVASLAALAPRWKNLDRQTRWLIKAFGVVFLFFLLSGSRRSYYILPITPLCALLMSVFLIQIIDDRARRLRHWAVQIQKYICLGIILFELALPLTLLVPKMRDNFEVLVHLGISGLVVAAAAGLCLWTVRRYSLARSFPAGDSQEMVGLMAATAILFGGFFGWQQGILDNLQTERPFVEKVDTLAGNLPVAEVGFFPKPDAGLLFYLGPDHPAQALRTSEDWQRFLTDKQPKILVTRQKYVSKIPPEYSSSVPGEPDIVERTQPWDSALSRGEKWVAWIFRDGLLSKPSVSGKRNDAQNTN